MFTFCPLGGDLGCNPAGVPGPGAATATDACGAPTITSALGAISENGCLRTQTRTYTATDGCLNTTICTQVFTWKVDVTPPSFYVCPPDLILNCGDPLPAVPQLTANDACTQATVVYNGQTGNGEQYCPTNRTYQRSWIATDLCNNSTTCVQNITFAPDVTPPTIVCPPAIVVDCPANVPAPNTDLVTASDACSGPVTKTWVGDVVSDSTCGSRYLITRTYKATDRCNNMSTCTQVIVVNDQTGPAISCPFNAAITCVGELPPVNNNAVASNDGCGGTVVVTFSGDIVSDSSCVNRKVITRTYTATDRCGNIATCSQVITVNDIVPPTVVCPNNIVVGQCNPVNFTPNGSDCSGVQFSSVPPSGSTFGVGITTVTVNASDACGNTASCQFNVSVIGNPTCSLLAPSPLPSCNTIGNTISTNLVAGATYLWTIAAADGGWGITGGQGTNQLTYSAGTGSATFTVVVTNSYNCSVTCYVTFEAECALQHCTYTQGFYGGNGKNCAKMSVLAVIQAALNNGGSLILGSPSTTRTIEFKTTEASCINSKLPAGSTPAMLPTSNGLITCATAVGSNYLSNGRFNSVLIGQTLALGLNMRNDNTLGAMVLTGNQFTTSKASTCVNGTAVPGTSQTFCIPANVWNCLSAPKTVQKLYTLANQALGGTIPAGCTASISQINDAVTAINEGFDKCRILTGFSMCTQNRTLETEAENVTSDVVKGAVSLSSFPNPMGDNATIEFHSDIDAMVTVDVYSYTGELVSTLFKGRLFEGEGRNVQFDASQVSNGIYICKMMIGDRVYYHKMIVSK